MFNLSVCLDHVVLYTRDYLLRICARLVEWCRLGRKYGRCVAFTFTFAFSLDAEETTIPPIPFEPDSTQTTPHRLDLLLSQCSSPRCRGGRGGGISTYSPTKMYRDSLPSHLHFFFSVDSWRATFSPIFFIFFSNLSMTVEFTTSGAGAAVEGDSGFFDDGAGWGLEGEGFFEEAFVIPGDGVASPFALASPPRMPPPSPSPSTSPSLSPSKATTAASAVSFPHSLDDVGINTLNDTLVAGPTTLTTSTYTPCPHILANQPVAPSDPDALYPPLTTSHFRSAAEAKAHRRRARLAPKSHATDITRVKTLGRDYWVCRIYHAMINSRDITDGEKSVHRMRFTRLAAFDALDLEAAAHAVFDEAIAVHERGWNRSTVYHKHTVRGKLVDISGASVELRLSRICLVLGETKSAVDDAVRGGLTLALLCDNPEARRFTKESNNVGNQKRGERLKQTASRDRAKGTVETRDGAEVEEAEIESAEKTDE